MEQWQCVDVVQYETLMNGHTHAWGMEEKIMVTVRKEEIKRQTIMKRRKEKVNRHGTVRRNGKKYREIKEWDGEK